MRRSTLFTASIAMLLGCTFALVGCKKEDGAGEEMGKKADELVDKANDAAADVEKAIKD